MQKLNQSSSKAFSPYLDRLAYLDMSDLAAAKPPVSRLELNRSRWPVIEVTNPLRFSDSEWDALIGEIVEVLRRDQPFAMVNDVRLGPPPSAQQRRAISKMYEKNLTLVKKNWRGTAIVTSSSLIKGAITALNWLMPPPHPVKVCANYEEGERWAFEQLGLEVAAPRPVAKSA